MSSPFYSIYLQHDADRVPVVVLHGEFDLAAVGDLATCFSEVLGPAVTEVNLDLAEVSFIDSAALGVIVDAFRELRDRDGGLVVTAVSAFAARTFEIAGLASYLLPSRGDGDPLT